MKKFVLLVMAALMAVIMAGCSENNSFDAAQDIYVISREDGSGTRGAFIELFGIEQKNESGEKIDYTTQDAAITSSTAVMLTSVAGDETSIGYVSLGSLNDTVRAVPIDGIEASIENVKNGSYKVVRPFNIATKGELSAAAQDFINYILSSEGQRTVEENGYISAVQEAAPYVSTKPAGKVEISGSTSVTPVMEKLKEAYEAINTEVEIEINMSDSSAGMTNTIEGSCDIGMASRALKDSELEKGLTATTIALDGIAVIVNHDNPIEGLTTQQVGEIFMGEATTWADIMEG